MVLNELTERIAQKYPNRHLHVAATCKYRPSYETLPKKVVEFVATVWQVDHSAIDCQVRSNTANGIWSQLADKLGPQQNTDVVVVEAAQGGLEDD